MSASFTLSEELRRLIDRYEQLTNGAAGTAPYLEAEEFADIVSYYHDTNQLDNANEALTRGLALHPNEPELLYMKASMLLNDGEINASLQMLDTYRNIIDDYDADMVRIRAYCMLNRVDDAVSVADHIVSTNTDDLANIALDISSPFIDNDLNEIALRYLLLGKDYDEKHCDLLFELAICLDNLNRTEEAQKTYRAIIDIDPYNADAWFNLGLLQLDSDDITSAYESFDYCTSIDMTMSVAWLQKGETAYRFNRFDETLRDIERYFSLPDIDMHEPVTAELIEPLGDDGISALCLMGDVCLEMSQPATALCFYEVACEIRPNVIVLTHLAYAYLMAGEAVKAINTARQALTDATDVTDRVYLRQIIVDAHVIWSHTP